MENFRLFAVTGNPVIHSKSPDIYNALFEARSIDAAYVRLLAQSANEAFEVYESLEMSGMNVTAPFKEPFFSLLPNKDESALVAGGVNTVTGDENVKGYSTDAYGVEQSLRSSGAVKKMKSVVLGAGGAARAAIVALKNIECDITVVNRTDSKAEAIASEYGVDCAAYDELAVVMAGADILVSTLPAGADSGVDSMIRRGMIVLDANYKASALAESAKNAGAVFVNGFEWLINQALPAFELYSSGATSFEEVKNIFKPEDVSSRSRSIVLTGFMGSGKSSVGARLAKISGRLFFDTDLMIEEKCGKKITEIFASEGEEYFRALETEVLSAALEQDNAVVSCGGGIVLSEKNRSLIKTRAINIWLYSPIASTVARLDGSRPLLNVENPMEKACSIFRLRKKHYAKCCDLLVFNNGRSAENTAEMINAEINTLSKY